MKKITLLLFTIMATTTMFAADVTWEGWIETVGTGDVQVGDDAFDSKKDAILELDDTTIDLTFSLRGEQWGGTSTIEVWADNYSALLDDEDGVAPAPILINTYAWTKYLDGMITLYGGINMWPINYTPSPGVEGNFFFDGYAYGRGSGAYDYHVADGSATGGVTGIIGEFNFDALTFAVVVENGSTTKVEDLADNSIILNAKYETDILTGYAGYAFEEDNNGLWIAVSTNLAQGLMADIKYETNFTPSDQEHLVSLNLGYDFSKMNVASETNITLSGDDVSYIIGAQVVPYWTPVFVTSLNSKISGNNADDSKISYLLGFDITKEIGNVANIFSVKAGGLMDPDIGILTITYAYTINMWF